MYTYIYVYVYMHTFPWKHQIFYSFSNVAVELLVYFLIDSIHFWIQNISRSPLWITDFMHF